MGDWARSTRDCAFNELPPEMIEAVNQHLELYNLGPLASQATACIETTSKKRNGGVFSHGEEIVRTGAMLAPGWLLWAIRGESPEVAVMSARLAALTVQDYAATPFAKMVPDAGVEVSGLFTDVAEPGSAFIGLGERAAAQNFKRALMKAVQEARR